ncbi:hypothetical protein CEXT_202621 [Caerostris extrusa]|uniref:Uncharacterized protein n=1 Tax=Caerostris extrusa TaxID=172846 RepID=A0AAV4SUA7_CAEEX|nr:hypothetical protein CEXT_202621 [Caerostris extrusa]
MCGKTSTLVKRLRQRPVDSTPTVPFTPEAKNRFYNKFYETDSVCLHSLCERGSARFLQDRWPRSSPSPTSGKNFAPTTVIPEGHIKKA